MQRPTSRIAVVIPVYRAHYLGDCLASVFAQTQPPDQVIVVDDGSPDRAAIAEAVAPFQAGVRLLRQENAGAGAARNLGIRHADTELIAFLDADDLWCPQLLARQTAPAERGSRSGPGLRKRPVGG